MSHETPAQRARQNARHRDGKYAEMHRPEGDLAPVVGVAELDATGPAEFETVRREDSPGHGQALGDTYRVGRRFTTPGGTGVRLERHLWVVAHNEHRLLEPWEYDEAFFEQHGGSYDDESPTAAGVVPLVEGVTYLIGSADRIHVNTSHPDTWHHPAVGSYATPAEAVAAIRADLEGTDWEQLYDRADYAPTTPADELRGDEYRDDERDTILAQLAAGQNPPVVRPPLRHFAVRKLQRWLDEQAPSEAVRASYERGEATEEFARRVRSYDQGRKFMAANYPEFWWPHQWPDFVEPEGF